MFSVIAALLLGLIPGSENSGPPISSNNPAIEVPAEAVENGNVKSDEQINAIIAEGMALERENRLGKALELYSEASHKFPNSRKLQAQFSRIKVLCDIQKRYGTDWYFKTVQGYDSVALGGFVRNFFNVFQNNYVQKFSPSEIFYRETRCMDIALGSNLFCSHVLHGVKRESIEGFRKELRGFVQNSVVQTQEELIVATLQLGQRFQNHFQRNASWLVLEGLFGYVTSLDAYSEVLLPEKYQEIMASVLGNMVGVGVTIKTLDGETKIVGIIPGSPADQSDLERGDLILAIDGTSVNGWTLEQVSSRLEGVAGSTLVLDVQSRGKPQRRIVISRKAFTISGIGLNQILPGSAGIAYIHLSGFQQNTASELNQILLSLKSRGMNALVLDLRGNPGGTVEAAVAISDLFLERGIILQIQGPNSTITHYAHAEGPWKDLPITVLIDEHSASASEIFAGAIQAQKRGEIVGKKSFGKGTIQTMFPIPGSSFVMKLSTAQFFGPNGQRYNYVGVSPNYEVREVGKVIFEENGMSQRIADDPVLKKAVEILQQNPQLSMN